MVTCLLSVASNDTNILVHSINTPSPCSVIRLSTDHILSSHSYCLGLLCELHIIVVVSSFLAQAQILARMFLRKTMIRAKL
mmetsp:Transcript_2791/g.6692  ORF Transcript_2791/g.6692 Transcript_2791/m.6692 type:complete len:81 (+) Transcript_2791:1151-1393(+)